MTDDLAARLLGGARRNGKSTGLIDLIPPMFASARYEGHADGIRTLIAESLSSIHVPRPNEITFLADPPPVQMPDLDRWVLTVRKVWALAPYVDRPYIYVWRAAVDEDGEYVTGPAELRYVLSESEWAMHAPTSRMPWNADYDVRRNMWSYL